MSEMFSAASVTSESLCGYSVCSCKLLVLFLVMDEQE